MGNFKEQAFAGAEFLRQSLRASDNIIKFDLIIVYWISSLKKWENCTIYKRDSQVFIGGITNFGSHQAPRQPIDLPPPSPFPRIPNPIPNSTPPRISKVRKFDSRLKLNSNWTFQEVKSTFPSQETREILLWNFQHFTRILDEVAERKRKDTPPFVLAGQLMSMLHRVWIQRFNLEAKFSSG